MVHGGREPYEQFTNPDDLFQRLEEGIRLSIDAQVPNVLKEIILACWKPNPNERPSFQDIFNRLEILREGQIISRAIFIPVRKRNSSLFMETVERHIDEPLSKDFWIEYFEFQEEVKIVDLVEALNKFFRNLGILSPESSEKWSLYVTSGILSWLDRDEKDSESIIKLQQFGEMMSYFGPLYSMQNKEFGTISLEKELKPFSVKMFALFLEKWHHGKTTGEDAEKLLRDNKQGFFLLRCSAQPGNYTISFLQTDADLVHIRIKRTKGALEMTLNGSIHLYLDEWDLIANCTEQFSLTTACPGSRYYTKFCTHQRELRYLN